MKKIIAILLALAVVSMAFAQTVSVSNKLETNPQIHVDGSTNQWSVSPTLKDTVEGKLTTEDGRATVWGKASFQLQWKDSIDKTGAVTGAVASKDNKDIASFTPRYVFTASSEANASFKPFEFLEVGLGTGLGGGATGIVSVGPGFAWEGGCGAAAKPYALDGDRQKVTREGMYVAFTGVPGLSVIAGVDNKFGGAGFALIKKNVFGAGVGAKYATDLFEVGASWRAVFGLAENPVAEDKAYNNQSIYVGGTFKGLESLPVGISINAKASIVMNNGATKTTDIGLGVGASFNFNNGIKTSPDFSIAFKAGGESYKVLPFYVGNTLEFKPNDDVTFKLLTGYAQHGLTDKMSSFTVETGRFSAITLKPEFSFSMGRHSFNFAVKTVVTNNHQYVEKTDTDWAFSRMFGECAKVEFPISWTYNF